MRACARTHTCAYTVQTYTHDLIRHLWQLCFRLLFEKEERKGHIILAVGKQGRDPFPEPLLLPEHFSDTPQFNRTAPIARRRKPQRLASLPNIPLSRGDFSENRLTNSPVYETSDCSPPGTPNPPGCESPSVARGESPLDVDKVSDTLPKRKPMMRSASANSFAKKGQSLPLRVSGAGGVPLAVGAWSVGKQAGMQRVRILQKPKF